MGRAADIGGWGGVGGGRGGRVGKVTGSLKLGLGKAR